LASGEKWKWTKELNNPKPDTLYNVDDRYFYKNDASGSVGNVNGNLNLKTFDRNKCQQCLAGKCRSVNDEGEHLIASIFFGPGEKLNIVPMDGNLNKGEWKKIGNEQGAALKENKNVQVDISPMYDGMSKRPSNFEVRYRIDGDRMVTRRLKNSLGGV
jgi:filamentous hemagglutinin